MAAVSLLFDPTPASAQEIKVSNNIPLWGSVLFMVLCLASRHACGVSFEFHNFSASSQGLRFEGSAGLTAYGISLTSNKNDLSTLHRTGRVFWDQPVSLWSHSSKWSKEIASFNTSFLFNIKNIGSDGYGDGLAFFIAPSLSPPPLQSDGMWLGLFNESVNGSATNQIVAVEFDTFQNYFDINDNHVGIDVNGVFSKAYVSVLDRGISLKNGSDITAWIDYSGLEKSLRVYLSISPYIKPENDPFISYDVDLSAILSQQVFVGFSASTGDFTEIHRILSWTFTTTEFGNVTYSPPKPEPYSETKKSHSHTVIIASPVSTFCFILIVSAFTWFVWQKRKSRQHQLPDSSWDVGPELTAWECTGNLGHGPHRFTYKQLSVATKNFGETEFLGKGGFGAVYKGNLDKFGEVAVKCISQNSKQGEREFISEVTIISRVRHRNILELRGWCHERGHLLVVYDYMPNGSLDKYLFNKGGQSLDWNSRYKIVCGLAAALLYLHEEWEQRVIHRDVKSSNVLLDSDFNAKLGDFGLARLIKHDEMPHTTLAAGTLGYLAPEFGETAKATAESDVYSFGTVALEVACGRRPLEYFLPEHEVRLVDWVWSLNSQRSLLDAVDPTLRQSSFDQDQMNCLLVVSLACCHPDPKSRPTMRQVLDVLIGRTQPPSIPDSKPVMFYGVMLPRSVEPHTPTSAPDCSKSISASSLAPMPSSSSSSAPMPSSSSSSAVVSNPIVLDLP